MLECIIWWVNGAGMQYIYETLHYVTIVKWNKVTEFESDYTVCEIFSDYMLREKLKNFLFRGILQ